MNITSQLLIVLAAICWGLLGIFTRPLTDAGLSVIDMAAVRSMIAATCFIFILLIVDKEKLRIKIKDVWIFVCMGLFGFILTSVFYITTMNLISLSVASIILYTSPYLVMLQSALIFKEKITINKISALLIAFTGCVMTIGIDRVEVPITGIFTGVIAALSYSLYTIFGKFALKKYSPLTATVYPAIMASILLIPFFDYEKIVHVASVSNENLINLLVLSVLLTALPSMCYVKGLEKLEPSRASIISFVEPLTAAIVGIVIFSEMLSITRIFGMAFIFIALIILNLRRKAQ